MVSNRKECEKNLFLQGSQADCCASSAFVKRSEQSDTITLYYKMSTITSKPGLSYSVLPLVLAVTENLVGGPTI